MILRYGKRDFPAVFFSSCSNISLNNFTVFQARGMGVIAEACRNINVDGIKVVPFDSRRYLSTCADALHLVNCSGEILINNCVFKNQMDDSINIHGIYSLIERVVGSCSVLARLEHGQHQGSIIAFPNNRIRIVKRDSLQAVGELTVESVYKINSKYYLISFNSRIPENIKTGMAMENISLRPDKVKITNCISKNNNPRGILISTGQEVIIENNYISSPEAAIRISGDANSWYESGPVERVIIRNNRFEHCGYSARNPNNAIIDIDPEIKRLDYNFFYHGDIIVKDNIFTDFTCRLIHGNSFEGLNFTNNIVVQNVHSCENDLFELNHYKDVQIDNNQINKSCNNVPMRETVSV
jgi:nitrous oxidase accessory protein NosD